MANDNNSLAHTTWNCKYHIVFAPKYRRKIFYGEHKAEIGKILRELCDWKGIHIVEAEVCPDHIHMLVEIPPKESEAGIMGEPCFSCTNQFKPWSPFLCGVSFKGPFCFLNDAPRFHLAGQFCKAIARYGSRFSDRCNSTMA